MDERKLLKLLERVRSGDVAPDDAVAHLKGAPFEAVGGFAQVDTHRALRIGMHIQSIGTTGFSDSVIIDPTLPSHTNIASVTAKDAAQTEVSDTDPASYYTTLLTA